LIFTNESIKIYTHLYELTDFNDIKKIKIGRNEYHHIEFDVPFDIVTINGYFNNNILDLRTIVVMMFFKDNRAEEIYVNFIARVDDIDQLNDNIELHKTLFFSFRMCGYCFCGENIVWNHLGRMLEFKPPAECDSIIYCHTKEIFEIKSDHYISFQDNFFLRFKEN